MNESLIEKATKRRYKYDIDGIRFSVKYFVEDFNAFYLKNNRPPLDHDKEEHALYLRWHKYRNVDNLNAAETEYIEKNLVKIGNINWLLQKFVNEYNKFVKENNRTPVANAKTKEERSVYSRLCYYTHTYKPNEDELQLLIDNNIVSTDNIRKKVKEFVKEYNEFIEMYGRKPKNGNTKEENSLYSKYLRYTNPEKLNNEELIYVNNNLIKVKKIRDALKTSVADYLNFVQTHGRKPRNNSSNHEETLLYGRIWTYTYAPNIRNEEIQYLLDHGLKVRGIDKLIEYGRVFQPKGEINEI